MGASQSPSIRARNALVALLCAAITSASCGGNGTKVAIIVNSESALSVAIGEAYRAHYDIPQEQVLAIQVHIDDPTLRSGAHETISRERYRTLVRDPIAHQLDTRGLRSSVEILVTTKGVPLRIDGPAHSVETLLREGTRASVDAELALLFTNAEDKEGVAERANPYYGSDLPFGEFRKRAGDAARPRYLVARLTGYADELDSATGIPADIAALIAASEDEPGTEAVWLVDADATHRGAYAAGDRVMLSATAGALRAAGVEVLHDELATFRSEVDTIQGYASWGSNDGADPGKPYYGKIDGRVYPGRFAPRAIAADFVSTNARSFAWPPSYGQSLVADLIRQGAAGVAGHVDEPTLTAVGRPHILLGRYARGATAAEAYWSSVPYLGWTNVWIGDPLLHLDPAPGSDTDDADGDGIEDSDDNCIRIPNPEQRDTDSDGFGNFCDADINNDGTVTSSWGQIFPLGERGDIEWIVLTARSEYYDENHDLDGDGKVDGTDVSIAQLGLYHPPGPSGRRPR